MLEKLYQLNKSALRKKLKDILTPGLPGESAKWLPTTWFVVIDFAPGGNSTNKILSDKLETIREPNQSKNFQTNAMEILETLNFLDISMKRMGDKPVSLKYFHLIY